MARSPKPQRKQSQRTPESRDPGSVSNENRSSLSEYDKKILAAPTPLELAPTPGSETIHPYAQAAYDDMQTSLDSLVGAIKQDYDNGNRSGNIHVSPGGPGLDTLNLIALVSHQKSGEKGHYKPTDTPNASLAQQTITAFPNPKDLLIAANTHIEQLSILNQRRGITIDQAHERNTLYRLMKTIYGERFSEFQTQAVAEAQAAQEAEAKSVLEQQLEEAVKYKGREVLGNSKSATLRRREWVNKKHHELQSRAAERRNALSTPKHIILAWRKNRAEARLRR
ncbi:hypothetical protein EOL96_04360, partial [Candidatus Saccharibacteria bacterium]|nr:hypothetical protein [Candidatus Saccharibacteria bacterium]